MTCEEEEEMQHDKSKLQDQVQQISLSLKVNKAKMNGVEAKMNGMDDKMDELKINLNNLLQEIVTNGEKVL